MQSFRKTEKKLTKSDLDEIEHRVGRALPDAFRMHYLEYNGGTPTWSLYPESHDYEDILIASFFPMKYNALEENAGGSTLEGKYVSMVSRQVIPDRLLPFADDFGGNFICLDLVDGSVSFFATDAFDSELSIEKNQKKAQRRLAPSFADFMRRLEDAEL